MSNSVMEQARNKRIQVKPVVEYSAVNTPLQEGLRARQEQRIVNDVIGVPIAAIREGCAVMCRDGKAGRVAGIVTHPQRGYPTHIIVRHGRLRRRAYRVAFNWVTGITPETIELNLSKRDLAEQPEYLPDDEIAEAVEAMFHGADAFHERSDYLAIRATVADGIVTLRGNVRDSPRRLEAEQLVNRMRGVRAVQNLLFADDEIAWKASCLLQHDARLQIRNLHIETCLGLVRLHGQIASVSQRALATAIVKQVPGVHAVNNGLVVAPMLEPRTDTVPVNFRQQVEELIVC